MRYINTLTFTYLLKLTTSTDRHEASRGLFATAELLFWFVAHTDRHVENNASFCGRAAGKKLVPVLKPMSHVAKPVYRIRVREIERTESTCLCTFVPFHTRLQTRNSTFIWLQVINRQ